MHERESEVAQSCLTLRDPMDCSLPVSSAHGIFQARVLEWGAIAFSGTYCILECIFKASLIYVTLLLLLHFQQQWIRVLVAPFLPSIWFWIFAACFWICHKGNLPINCWIGGFVGEGFLFCHLADSAAIWCFQRVEHNLVTQQTKQTKHTVTSL